MVGYADHDLSDCDQIGNSGSNGSTIAEIDEFNDLDGAGVEIEHANRGEDQIELQPEPERLYRIGRENRIRWKNRVGRQCPVAAHHHKKSRHDGAEWVCGKDGAWGQEDA